MADDATERLLKEQARAHGLEAYAPEPEGVAPKTIAYAIRQDAERDEAALRGFAGLRGGASSSFEIGAQWSAAPPPAPAPIGLDLTAFESVDALAAEGLDALKAELTRRGAKAGGTADERAARLWRIRGLAPGAALPADLRAKQKRPKKPPANTEEEPTARARRGPAAPPKPPKRRKKPPPQGHLIATSTFSKKERSILDFAGTSSR